ncbi:hypothetical protein [Nostoc sp. 106C]|uniref:hypothetical protein n=1 Tax=Nostoc sp. 106C TaxID=1932667 RepID=UPI000A38D3CC|nr:hypothetical protein [Nostoc sp. 106C]OUL33963.1 hypothetical protein BV375_06175 [Nostoc sp. 106C]
MTLSSDIEEFRTLVSKVVEQLDDINSISKTIPGTEVDELSRKFAGLMDNLEDVDEQLRSVTDLLEEIRSRWG